MNDQNIRGILGFLCCRTQPASDAAFSFYRHVARFGFAFLDREKRELDLSAALFRHRLRLRVVFAFCHRKKQTRDISNIRSGRLFPITK